MKATQEQALDMVWSFEARLEGLDEWGSPIEAVDIEFVSVVMFGDTYTYKDLVQFFGQHGADGLIQAAREELNDDWEEEQ